MVKEQVEQGRIFNGSHHLNNFKIQRYYQIQSKFNGIYSKNIYLISTMRHI